MSILGPILLTIQVLYAILGLTEGNSYKIVGGFEVWPKYKYSYMAYFFSYRNKCGATIINEKHALTAAHCIKTQRPTSKHFLIVGHHRINRIDAIGPNPEFVFGSDYIIRVKEFIFRRDGKDIAILRLERSIVFNSRVGPACLPSLPAPTYANMEAVATGWGGTVGYDPGQYVDQNSSFKLREVTLNVVPPNTRLCTKAISDQEAYMCTYTLGKDTCQGDSGGPLTIRQNGVFVLIGVVHAGSGCGAQDYASIYTRVSYFVNWIKENVGQVCMSGAHGESSHSHSHSSHSQTSQSETSTNNADCSCSSFINPSGFGNCKKKDKDFGGKVSCYVKTPTSCTDLSRSGTNPDKFLSAQACQGGPSPIPSTISPMLQPSTMSPMVTSGPIMAPNSGCSCSDFVNKNRFGRCRKADWAFTGSKFGIMSCYVNMPSTCVDLIRSGSNPGKYLSTQACTNGPVEAPLEQVTAPPFPIITAPPVESNSGCRCSNFVNRNGFGLCRKPDSDFGRSVSCYVMVPSSCPDLIRSGSNPDKFLSAEACRLRRRTENLGS